MAHPAEDFANGVAAFERGDLDLAVSLLLAVPASDPAHYPRALPYLGRAYLRLNQHERAKDYLRRAAEHMRTAEAHYEFAELLISQGSPIEAQAHLHEAIKRDAKFTDAYIRLGMLHYQDKQHVEAIRWLEAAILLDAKALVARYYLAQSCLAVGNKQRAISQLHFVLHVKPDYVPARMLRADIFQSLNDHRQALVEFCDIAEQNPKDPAVFLRMAKSFQALGDRRQAMFALEQAFKLQPTMVAVGAEAARMREEEGHLRTALKLYRMLLAADKNRPTTREAIARLEERLQIAPVAVSEAEPPLDEAPEPEVRFEPPQVQPESTPTLPLMSRDLATGRLNPPKKRTEPLRPKTQPLAEDAAPTVMTSFLAGMVDFLKGHIPEPMRQRVDKVRQSLDVDAIKRRLKS